MIGRRSFLAAASGLLLPSLWLPPRRRVATFVMPGALGADEDYRPDEGQWARISENLSPAASITPQMLADMMASIPEHSGRDYVPMDAWFRDYGLF